MSAQSNDKGVCKFAVTHPQPLFLEGSLKVAAFCWFNRPRLNRNVSVQAASPEPAEYIKNSFSLR